MQTAPQPFQRTANSLLAACQKCNPAGMMLVYLLWIVPQQSVSEIFIWKQKKKLKVKKRFETEKKFRSGNSIEKYETENNQVYIQISESFRHFHFFLAKLELFGTNATLEEECWVALQEHHSLWSTGVGTPCFGVLFWKGDRTTVWRKEWLGRACEGVLNLAMITITSPKHHGSVYIKSISRFWSGLTSLVLKQ